MDDIDEHTGCCGRGDLHYHADEVLAYVAAKRAERYVALVAQHGEAIVNAMITFPWSSPPPKEGGCIDL